MPTDSPALFGVPTSPEDAAIVILPVPFDATASYERGAHRGPEAVLTASPQIDFCDHHFGEVIHQGIAMLPLPEAIAEQNRALAPLCDQARTHPTPENLQQINAGGAALNTWVYENAQHWLEQGKIVGVLGGDHSTPFGAIAAHAEKFDRMGVLHIDAHHDLRDAYEGFQWSHASIMRNVLEQTSVASITQVGIRDFCVEERDFAAASPKVVTFYDQDLADARLRGETFAGQCDAILKTLPEQVYVSLDIDGLDPALCPNTGTPVPGGLSFHQLAFLLQALVASGKTIVGFDLCEVSPGKSGEWDANVGMRTLYKLCGAALSSKAQT
jgi:agmatinase